MKDQDDLLERIASALERLADLTEELVEVNSGTLEVTRKILPFWERRDRRDAESDTERALERLGAEQRAVGELRARGYEVTDKRGPLGGIEQYQDEDR